MSLEILMAVAGSGDANFRTTDRSEAAPPRCSKRSSRITTSSRGNGSHGTPSPITANRLIAALHGRAATVWMTHEGCAPDSP